MMKITKEQVRRRILEISIVPVVRASSAEKALGACEALAQGGIPIVEVTMTVPGAIDAIRQLAKKTEQDLLIGAGTVLDASTARQCLEAGAQFIVSPGLDLETVKFAREADVLMIAGALTPTEIIQAWKAGADFIKVFPASAVGGPAYFKAVRGPLPQVPLIPTGGVNLNTAADFLRAGAAALGVGDDLVHAAALETGDFARISETAKKFIAIIRQARASN